MSGWDVMPWPPRLARINDVYRRMIAAAAERLETSALPAAAADVLSGGGQLLTVSELRRLVAGMVDGLLYVNSQALTDVTYQRQVISLDWPLAKLTQILTIQEAVDLRAALAAATLFDAVHTGGDGTYYITNPRSAAARCYALLWIDKHMSVSYVGDVPGGGQTTYQNPNVYDLLLDYSSTFIYI